MTKEALKLALEVLEEGVQGTRPLGVATLEAIATIEEALAQPEHIGFMDSKLNPPQRTWVGLTDEEIDKIYEAHHNQYGECESVNFGYERAIEAKLRSKND